MGTAYILCCLLATFSVLQGMERTKGDKSNQKKKNNLYLAHIFLYYLLQRINPLLICFANTWFGDGVTPFDTKGPPEPLLWSDAWNTRETQNLVLKLWRNIFLAHWWPMFSFGCIEAIWNYVIMESNSVHWITSLIAMNQLPMFNGSWKIKWICFLKLL